MYIILGGTGHVGSQVALTLLSQKEPVIIITHNPSKEAEWTQLGAQVAVVDVHDSDQLRRVFQQGQRLFVLNPPADPSSDTDQQERKSLASILKALVDSGIQKIVAQSTYGAQPGERIGDLGILYELEQGLEQTGIPTTILRAAYYMSNWDHALGTAQKEGKVYTFYPPDFKLPMVAPQDLGQQAARLLREPISQTGLYYVEGPVLYSSADVAATLTTLLEKQVTAIQIPPEQWIATLKELGFSPVGAESMAAMTAITLEQKYDLPDSPLRGSITLQAYLGELAKSGS